MTDSETALIHRGIQEGYRFAAAFIENVHQLYDFQNMTAPEILAFCAKHLRDEASIIAELSKAPTA